MIPTDYVGGIKMEKKDSNKGLAGLSSMVTNVQAIEQYARSQSARTQTSTRNEGKSQTMQSPVGLPINQISQNRQESSNRRQQAKRRDRLIALGLGLVLIVFFLFKAGGGKSTSSSNSQQPRANTTNSSMPLKPQNTSQLNSIATRSPKKNVVTGYDDNHPYLNDNGLCEITIDNSKNDMPVYVRIWDMQQHKPVRAFYISQGGTFTADELTPGRYEIRYRELYENGDPSHGTKSQIYTMEQHRTSTGTRYDTLSLTLYKVRNGNARTERIDAGDI